MIKLNLVHTGCMGYTWKIVIPRKFSHRRESSEPPCQASQPGGLATGGVAPKNLLCRPVRFDHRNFTGLEETETVLLKDAHRVSRIPRPRRKSSNLLRGWGRLSCEYQRVSCRTGGWLWLTAGTKTLWWQFWGILTGMSPLGSCLFLTKTWSHPTIDR